MGHPDNVHTVETVTEPRSKPVLDEQTFQKVLEAAFVLQEHNRRLRLAGKEKPVGLPGWKSPREDRAPILTFPKALKLEAEEAPRANVDYTLVLAEIVEAQHQIQTRHLALDDAIGVVAEKVTQIAHGCGAGIGILEGASVRYRGTAGLPGLPVGTEVPLTSAICQATVRTGQVIRTGDVNTEFLFDPHPVRERGIRSLLAVPIHFDGNIVGALELYFGEVHGYAEQDVHTCQLMAGLVTEAMGRDAGVTLKKSMAAERSSMLAAIEKLQPKLAALAEPKSAPVGETAAEPSKNTAVTKCSNCGNDLTSREQFCGKCGAPKVRTSQENAAEPVAAGDSGPGTAPIAAVAAPDDNRSDFSLEFTEGEAAALADSLASEPEAQAAETAENDIAHEDATETGAPSRAIVPVRDDLVWTSAARAQDFLESLAATQNPGALLRFWRSRRGDFYLGLAIALVVLVIGWGLWPGHPSSSAPATAVSKTANRGKVVPVANLSVFDKLLIGLGLADPPDVPEYKGNPNVQVWVDLSTAQYYCPGSDLYEKTPKGKLSTQREAQLDQFEPAYRKVCD